MYLNLLNETVIEYLTNEGNNKKPIEIRLSRFIYNTLILEINDICKFKTEVPIEFINITSIELHSRTIKLTESDEIDPIFEKKIVAKLAQLSVLEGTY